VQDYHLLLVPGMLRELRPNADIGFFLHIPFPPPELVARLPWRDTLLDGLLGADSLGFHTEWYRANFVRSVQQSRRDVTVSGDVIYLPDGHAVRTAAHPISIDADAFGALATDPETEAELAELREQFAGRRVFLGVDRLDYTKGIRHRIKAFGELLEDGELAVGQACLVQVASPSRERVESYAQLREEVEGAVGRINGEFDTMAHTAVRYLHHSYPLREMVALYLAADVMLVTALRDGMNLVAKEFTATHTDNRGMLVLSEFAGAADQLRHAVLVNPHDIDGLKAAIMEAVNMPRAESTRRMRIMRRQISVNDVARWSRIFLQSLAANHGED
jgi:trehalose 6-phosphate synthase